MGRFAAGNGTVRLMNPRVLERVALYFEAEFPRRPLI
jgi:hypothetical protein